MKVLLACEHSGALRNAFSRLGHDATSCDYLESLSPGQHYQGDVFDLIDEHWDLVFAFPPCTYLAKAQMSRYSLSPSIVGKRNSAVHFVERLQSSFPRIVIENPVGYLNNNWKSPSQIVYPWWFGDPYSKEICLWLKDCPPIIATLYSVLRKNISNHVNGRMSRKQKSVIKSSWSHYPLMCSAIAHQYSHILV